MSDRTDPLSAAEIKQKALDLGFHKVGIARVADWDDDTAPNQALQRWLDQGHQAEMAWMDNPRRQDIRQVMPGIRSVISFALNYYTPHRHSDDPAIAKISRYGWGRDYHRVIGKKLKAFSLWLEAQSQPDAPVETRYYVDTGPISDKLWAQRAGLGWIAKNSNVITREYGSWVFLSEILTNLDLTPDRPHAQHCGSCTRCLDACPTQAFPDPFVVDANRCIAYHTIENRSAELPEAIAVKLNNWVAGCDICQDVCPWNQRFAQPTDVEDFHPYPDNLAPSLEDLAHLSEADWNRRFPASALRRIKPALWQRNAQANLPKFPPSNESTPLI